MRTAARDGRDLTSTSCCKEPTALHITYLLAQSRVCWPSHGSAVRKESCVQVGMPHITHHGDTPPLPGFAEDDRMEPTQLLSVHIVIGNQESGTAQLSNALSQLRQYALRNSAVAPAAFLRILPIVMPL